ncbi:hypothetical protein [Paraglaciecola sp.]|uniref:hypothetical protein n=1 Tax=Paraglaciecola sp. TaxID=1920173 RepID=UPI003EF0B50D
MTDNSGIVLFDEFTGLTAFLNPNPDNIPAVVNLLENGSQFTIDDFITMLDLTKDKSSRLIKWMIDRHLVESKFV